MHWSFKKLILILSGIFILVHNAIPHSHYIISKGSVIIHCEKNSDSVFGFINVVLHQNTGEGHLEYFIEGQSLDKSFGNPFILLGAKALQSDTFISTNIIEASFSNNFYTQPPDTAPPFLKSFSFRGPPFA